MSLLLDALKRAEQEKLARQGEASNDAAPTPAAAAPAARAAPAASLELQPLSSTSAGPARGEDSARAAQVMFDAKTAPGEEKRNRGMLWATLGAIAIVVGSAAAYVWYQIRVLSPSPAPMVVRRSSQPPLPQASAGTTPTTATTAAIAEPARPPSRATVTVVPEPPPRVASTNAVAPGMPAAEDDPVARMLRAAPATPAAAPLKLARTLDRPAIPADVSSGYEALRRGDIGEARHRYEAALAADSANLDARMGIATVEAKSGNRMLAVAQYRRVLEIDPRNATALASLAALAEGQSPEAVEAQLREDVARLPDSAALRFALGAQYASQRRWGEAQAAFFEAHRLDPTGADILYNLAVSLDHMEQSRLAADFYRRAVEAAQTQTTQFDPASARRRLAEISSH